MEPLCVNDENFFPRYVGYSITIAKDFLWLRAFFIESKISAFIINKRPASRYDTTTALSLLTKASNQLQ